MHIVTRYNMHFFGGLPMVNWGLLFNHIIKALATYAYLSAATNAISNLWLQTVIAAE